MRYGYGVVYEGDAPLKNHVFGCEAHAKTSCDLLNKTYPFSAPHRVVELHYDVPDVAALTARVEAAEKALREIKEITDSIVRWHGDGPHTIKDIIRVCNKALESKV